MLSTWVRSIEHSSTRADWLSLRRRISFQAVFRSAQCLSKLPLCWSPRSWKAFAIACWSTIKLATISSTPLILFLSSSFSLVTASRYKDRSLASTITSKGQDPPTLVFSSSSKVHILSTKTAEYLDALAAASIGTS